MVPKEEVQNHNFVKISWLKLRNTGSVREKPTNFRQPKIVKLI